MSTAWYLKRLARMSPAEIAHRFGEQAKRRMSRSRTPRWSDFDLGVRFEPLPGLRESLLANSADDVRAAVRAASDRLLGGDFAALGRDWPKRDPANLFPPGVWTLDPVTGRSWPGAERYCFDVSFRHERDLGDIKYVWEFNRLQFLQPLAAAYLLFDDKAALAAVELATASWMKANPPFFGLGWNSGIELALRATSILFAASICAPDLSLETSAMLGPLLEAHRYWLARFPSLYSSANNHRVAELMGEYLIEACFHGSDAQRRAPLARKLAEEASLQILADGAPAEQSPTYGAFTAEMLLICAMVARQLGAPLPEPVESRLGRYAEFVAALADESARTPSIGDDDEGRVVTLCLPREATYPTSVARLIGGFLSRATPIARPPSAQLRDALAVPPPAAPNIADGVITFPEGGYTIIRATRRDRRYELVFDHGPLGYLSIAAHGHADALALILGVDGEPILVDPGTYLYHSGAEWRDWFRGTRAHNTLSLGGVDQSIISGPFNWSSHARTALTSDASTPANGAAASAPPFGWSIGAAHDGYRKRFGVVHRRDLRECETGFIVEDRLLDARAPLEAEISFQLAETLEVRRQNEDYLISRAGEDILRIGFDARGEVRLQRGETDPISGWVSPSFGEKREAWRLGWIGPVDAAGVETRFQFIPRVAG